MRQADHLVRLSQTEKGKQMNQPAEQKAVAERQGIVAWAAQAYGVDPGKVIGILNATCFSQGKGEDPATDAEVASLMIVARAYGLNPFLRELFAFRDKKGGIVPVVGVDGWSRIINDKTQFDGLEFRYPPDATKDAPEWIECVIYRKDRSHPTIVRERLSECKRSTGPWQSHPSRMLRHKALIQCARVAFGFAGIYDEDEAQRIIEAEVTVVPADTPPERSATARLKNALVGAEEPTKAPTVEAPPESAPNLQERVAKAITDLQEHKDTETMRLFAEELPDDVRGHDDFTKAFAKRLGELNAAASKAIEGGGRAPGTPRMRKLYVEKMEKVADLDTLNVMYDETRGFDWPPADGALLSECFEKRKKELQG